MLLTLQRQLLLKWKYFLQLYRCMLLQILQVSQFIKKQNLKILNWIEFDFWGFVLKTHEEFVIWRNPNFSSSIHSGFLPIFTRLRRSASLNDEKHLPPPSSIQGGGTMRGERQGVIINYFLNLKSWFVIIFFWNDICKWSIGLFV